MYFFFKSLRNSSAVVGAFILCNNKMLCLPLDDRNFVDMAIEPLTEAIPRELKMESIDSTNTPTNLNCF